jgi:hypothetical protein
MFSVVAVQMLGCILIWRSMADSRMTGRSAIAFCIIALASGLALLILSQESKFVIVISVIGSALAANTANIAYDLFQDPTSHNLFPFELVITTILSLTGAAVALLAGLIRRKSNSASGTKE